MRSILICSLLFSFAGFRASSQVSPIQHPPLFEYIAAAPATSFMHVAQPCLLTSPLRFQFSRTAAPSNVKSARLLVITGAAATALGLIVAVATHKDQPSNAYGYNYGGHVDNTASNFGLAFAGAGLIVMSTGIIIKSHHPKPAPAPAP